MPSIPRRRDADATPAARREVSGQTVGQASSGLTQVQTRLHAIVVSTHERQLALEQFSRFAVELTNSVGAVYYERNAAGGLVPGLCLDVEDLLADEAHRRELDAWCSEASQSGVSQVHAYDADPGVHVVCVPVTLPEGPCEVLTAYLVLGGNPVEPFVLALQLVAANISLWYDRRIRSALGGEARAIAAVTELISKMEESKSTGASHAICVNELQRFVGCQRVALAVKRRRHAGVRLVAISGMANFDPQSETARALEAALNETTVRGTLTLWPPKDASGKRATLAHRHLAQRLGLEAVVSCPLQTTAGEDVGAWIFAGATGKVHTPRTVQLVSAAAPHVAAMLRLVRRAEPTPLGRLFRWATRSRGRWVARLLLVCAIAVVGLMLLPLPYKIRCSAVLEPSQRRFAVAPYEGLLETSLVETGDVVAQDQTLAVMDGKELRWELAGLTADRDRAAKKRDVSLAAHEIPDAQLAEMEVQRLDFRIKLLKYREDHLEIKSPVAGVVLVSKSENAERLPVQVGEALFEVAPLNPLKLLVDVPADEVAYVQEGHEVRLRLDAYPDRSLIGTISKIRPRSEIRDEENVFVTEVLMDNPNEMFRPGMDGQAKVVAARRPLGWILFHKAYDKVFGWLGL